MALRSRVLAGVAAALPLALAAACSGSTGPGVTAAAAPAPSGIPASPAPGTQHLTETGSTLLFPLLRTWAAAYHLQHANVSIATAATGSGKGIAEASAGAVDFGASDAYLSSGDLVTNPEMLNIPLAISAQQVNYNLPGLRPATHLKLNGKILALMYQGSITSWNDPRIAALNPGVALPHTRVVPLHRADSSGDTFLFTSYLSTQDAAWDRVTGYGTTVAWPPVPGARAETHNTGMVAGCEATPGCVAYIGIAYLNRASSDGLGYAQLQNAAGNKWELPTPASMNAAVQAFVSQTPVNETISMINGPAPGGYPIVNFEYAIVSTRQPDAAKARDVKAFLHWAITQGKSPQYLGQFQFQPLPPPIALLSDAQIAKIG